MNKRMLAGVLASSILLLGACQTAEQEKNEDVLVVTKEGNITKEDFYLEMKEAIGTDVLENLVIKLAIESEFEVTDDELEEAFENQKSVYGDQFDAYLEQKNMSEAFFKNQLKYQLLQQKVIASLDDVTDEEVEAAYEKMKKEVHARHILVEDKETAEKLIQEIKDGANFADVAKENTIEPVGKKTGGDLGWFSPGKMVQEFDDVAFELDVNEISEPVKSSFGYHIIEVLEQREKEVTQSIDELRTDIENNLYDQKFKAKIKTLLANIDAEIMDEDLNKALDEYAVE